MLKKITFEKHHSGLITLEFIFYGKLFSEWRLSHNQFSFNYGGKVWVDLPEELLGDKDIEQYRIFFAKKEEILEVVLMPLDFFGIPQNNKLAKKKVFTFNGLVLAEQT